VATSHSTAISTEQSLNADAQGHGTRLADERKNGPVQSYPFQRYDTIAEFNVDSKAEYIA